MDAMILSWVCDRRSVCWMLPLTHGFTTTTTTTTLLPMPLVVPSAAAIETVGTAAAAPTPATLSPPSTTSQLAGWITDNVPVDFLRAVRESGGRFLYRGAEESYRDVPEVFDPVPDLLLPETYGNDRGAVEYFEQLEALLVAKQEQQHGAAAVTTTTTHLAKPSNGHIATSDPSEAGKWGPIVSVWPLLGPTEALHNDKGNRPPRLHRTCAATASSSSFSYVWLRNRPVFYDGSQRGTLRGKDDALVIDRQLADALVARGGREVLFATPPCSAAFLAVPAGFDRGLRAELERIGYGLPRS